MHPTSPLFDRTSRWIQDQSHAPKDAWRSRARRSHTPQRILYTEERGVVRGWRGDGTSGVSARPRAKQRSITWNWSRDSIMAATDEVRPVIEPVFSVDPLVSSSSLACSVSHLTSSRLPVSVAMCAAVEPSWLAPVDRLMPISETRWIVARSPSSHAVHSV